MHHLKAGERATVRTTLIALSIFASACVQAAADIDCPQRDAPYTIDSPLMDVLLKPQARAAVEHEVPELLPAIPARFAGTVAPSFSAIISLRVAASIWRSTPDEALQRLDGVLRQLPVTDADRIARCERYDTERPQFDLPPGKPRLLLFEKMTGFRDGPSVEAAADALRAMAQRNGWALVATDRGGAMTAAILRQFDAVIWNNVSGDVLTLTQRAAFRQYIENGGGFVAIHGSGGDPIYLWDWYVDTLIGARFAGHPMAPQFQDAKVAIERDHPLGRSLPASWTMNDEWYSFKSNPREHGANILATLDESTYSPRGNGGADLRMGDHPIAWTHCIGKGRSFYSAIGHRPQTYSDANHLKLLEAGIRWAAHGPDQCEAAR